MVTGKDKDKDKGRSTTPSLTPEQLAAMEGDDDVLVLNARPSRRKRKRPTPKPKKVHPAMLARHWAAAAQACMFALSSTSDNVQHWRAAAKACLFSTHLLDAVAAKGDNPLNMSDMLKNRLAKRRPSQMEQLADSLGDHPELQASFRRGIAAIDGMLSMLTKLAQASNPLPSHSAFAASLATEVLLVSKRLSGIASAASGACEQLKARTDSLFKEAESWIGQRSRADNRNIMNLVNGVQSLMTAAASDEPVTVSGDPFELATDDGIAKTSVGYGVVDEVNVQPLVPEGEEEEEEEEMARTCPT